MSRIIRNGLADCKPAPDYIGVIGGKIVKFDTQPKQSVDQKILQLAAKAYGLDDYVYVEATPLQYGHMQKRNLCEEGFELQTLTFDSLNEDDDAFRLAVKLNIAYGLLFTRAVHRHMQELSINCPLKATRRAITLAAAEVGATL